MKKTLATALRVLATACGTIFPALLGAQSTDYYRSPLDIPIYLSANFAEIRTNRFHTGIDIKTQGVTGKPLYAAADGYIARVTVAPGGYGRALYIAHPNGTTTVYAHMDRFVPEIEEYLRAERYHRRRSDLDAFPEADRFPVKKGDRIGFAGNSGSSTGPHLHFEVRQSASSRTLNTIAKGWVAPAVRDDTPPRIVKLYHIEVDTIADVPVHSRPRAYDVRLNPDGNYTLVNTSPMKASGASYFVVEATDRKAGVTNTFGIYRASMSVDGEEKLVFEKDYLLFEDVRYACASVLYDIQRRSRNEAVMLAVKSGNRLPMYKKAIDRGVVTFEAKDGSAVQSRNIEISVEDDSGNAVSLVFDVGHDTAGVGGSPPERPEGYIASDRENFARYSDGFAVSIPREALYEPIFYTQSRVEVPVTQRADGIRPLSPLHRMGDGFSPLHIAARIAIAAEIPENLRSRACLAKVSDAGTLSYAGGNYADGSVTGTTRDFGTYCAVADTTAPVATSSFANGADLSDAKTVTLTATDNFSGIANFSGTIDGEWIIFERNASRGQFVHTFDAEKLQPDRTHILEFTVRDGTGNTTTLRRTFYK